MDLIKMREAWAAEVNAAKAIRDKSVAEKRDLADDEATQIGKHLETAAGLKVQIENRERHQAALSGLDTAIAELSKPAPRVVAPPQPGLADIRGSHKPPWEQRFTGKLTAFKGPNARQDAYKSGQWIKASLFGDQDARRWCADNGVQIGAVMGGTNTSGEYFVPEELSNAIIDLREQWGVARRVCAIQPMNRDVIQIPRRNGGVTAYAIGRVLTSSITASDASFSQIELTAKTWGALTLIARDLLDDAVINLADWVAAEMAYAFAEKEDDCFINGDGTSTYHGIYGWRAKIIDGTHTAGAKDAASGHDTFAEYDAADLATLMAALPQYALAGAAFMCSSVGYALVFQRLMAAGGGNTLGDLAGPAQYNYLGYPIIISQKMPTSTADISDTAAIGFGNWRMGAVLGDRMGFTAQVLQERYAELRQVGVVGATRFDINVHGLGDNTNAGPIVALIAE